MKINFFDRLPDMECLQGDTLPALNVTVNTEDSLSGCTMQVVLSRHYGDTSAAVLVKDCTLSESTFSVFLDSDDTSALAEDLYDIHFCLTGAGLHYRKLAGELYVRAAAQGGTA